MQRPKLLTVFMLGALALGACQAKEADNAAATTPAETAAATPVPAADATTPKPGPVKYRVELTPLWTKANFPFEYPDTSLIHKPHFSGMIGTAHNDGYKIYAEGQLPTPGLEHLSEEGKHSPLDSEIKAAITAGTALALAESDPLKDFTKTSSMEISVDDAHPMASIVAMIAPSPDWFAGVDVNLMENGAWVASKTVDVSAWDSGGDDGTTFLADDKDNNPKKPTTLNMSKHFLKDGKPQPVAHLTFTKL